MQYNRGVLSVPGYQRGRRKVVDEAERLRREEARLTNNTSGGRNAPREAPVAPVPNILTDPYAEPRFFGPAQGYDNDPVTGELIDDPNNRFGGVPVVEEPVIPVEYPDESPQAQQTNVLDAAEREAHWRDVWNQSGGFDLNAKGAYEQAREERMAIEEAGQGSPKDANPFYVPTPEETLEETVLKTSRGRNDARTAPIVTPTASPQEGLPSRGRNEARDQIITPPTASPHEGLPSRGRNDPRETLGGGYVAPPEVVEPIQYPDESPQAQQDIPLETVETPDGGNVNVNTTPDGGTSVVNEDGSESFFSPEQTAKVEGFLQDFFGLGLDEVKQVAGLYLASRATGASHQGSMIWAGNRILGQADAEAERERTQADEDLARQEQIDALTAVGYTPEQATAAVVAGWKPTTADAKGTKLGGSAHLKGIGKVDTTVRDGQEYIKVDGNEYPINDPAIAHLVEKWDESVHSHKGLTQRLETTSDAAWSEANQGAVGENYISDKKPSEWASALLDINKKNATSPSETNLSFDAVVRAQKRYAQDYVAWKENPKRSIKPQSPKAYVAEEFFAGLTGIPQGLVSGTSPSNFNEVDKEVRKGLDSTERDPNYIEEYESDWRAAYAAWGKVNQQEWIKRSEKLDGWSPFMWFVNQTAPERIAELANQVG